MRRKKRATRDLAGAQAKLDRVAQVVEELRRKDSEGGDSGRTRDGKVSRENL